MTTANTKGKYHISEDGVARKCQAEVKPCKYTTGDGADSHYDTREQAQAAYEQQRQNASVTASRKKSGKAKSNQHASKPLKDRIGELNAEADEFRANIIRLRKSIEKDIEREMERINNISRIKSEIALDELKAKGKALFQNVDDAAAFYNLAWELGNSPAYDGDREVSKAIDRKSVV